MHLKYLFKYGISIFGIFFVNRSDIRFANKGSYSDIFINQDFVITLRAKSNNGCNIVAC